MRDTGHADRYPALTINYINHHNPTSSSLTTLWRGDAANRSDASKTTKNIHKLLRMLGMRELCRDLDPSCPNWAKSGQCDANPDFMLQSCRKSCNTCAENDVPDEDGPPCVNTAAEHDCEYWSTMGECTKNEAS